MAVIVKLRQTGRKAQASHGVTFSMRASSFGPVPGGSKRACVWGLRLCVMINMSGQSQESPAPRLMLIPVRGLSWYRAFTHNSVERDYAGGAGS